MIRYRVVQHFGAGFKPIFAILEVEGLGYTTPPEIQEKTGTVQKGNWITATKETIPSLSIGPWAFAGSSSIHDEETTISSGSWQDTLIHRR